MKDKENSPGVFREWRAALLCLAAGGIFWFFNAMNKDYTANLSQPVRFVYDRDKFVPFAKIPATITCNATGYGWTLFRRSLLFNERPIYIKPRGLPKRNYITSEEIFPLFSTQLKDIKINYFLEDTIYLDFDHLREKRIFLNVNRSRLIKENACDIKAAAEIEPSYVVCRGPARIVHEFADTFLIDIPSGDISGEFNESVKIKFPEDENLKFDRQEVSVKFEILKLLSLQKKVRIRRINFPPGRMLLADSTTVHYFINPADSSLASDSDITVYADYEEIKGDEVPLKIRNLPKGILKIVEPGCIKLRP